MFVLATALNMTVESALHAMRVLSRTVDGRVTNESISEARENIKEFTSIPRENIGELSVLVAKLGGITGVVEKLSLVRIDKNGTNEIDDNEMRLYEDSVMKLVQNTKANCSTWALSPRCSCPSCMSSRWTRRSSPRQTSHRRSQSCYRRFTRCASVPSHGPEPKFMRHTDF